MGFCVAEIEGNEDCRFGMVGDVLLQTAVSWLRSKGIREIYLESGKDNRRGQIDTPLHSRRRDI